MGIPRYYRGPPTAFVPRYGTAPRSRGAALHSGAPQHLGGAVARCFDVVLLSGIAPRPGTTAHRLPRPRAMRYHTAHDWRCNKESAYPFVETYRSSSASKDQRVPRAIVFVIGGTTFEDSCS
jgi:hypothetical protein